MGWRLGLLLLACGESLRDPGTVSTQRALRRGVAHNLGLLLRILRVELVLRRVDDALRVRAFVLLNLCRGERLRGRIGVPGGLLDVRLREPGIGVDVADAHHLLGIDSSHAFAAVRLVWSRRDLSGPRQQAIVRRHRLRIGRRRRGGGVAAFAKRHRQVLLLHRRVQRRLNRGVLAPTAS
jgi:hypothetical protein